MTRRGSWGGKLRGAGGGGDAAVTATARTWWLPGSSSRRQRVRLVRGEGRAASSWYGVIDAPRPVGTGVRRGAHRLRCPDDVPHLVVVLRRGREPMHLRTKQGRFILHFLDPPPSGCLIISWRRVTLRTEWSAEPRRVEAGARCRGRSSHTWTLIAETQALGMSSLTWRGSKESAGQIWSNLAESSRSGSSTGAAPRGASGRRDAPPRRAGRSGWCCPRA